MPHIMEAAVARALDAKHIATKSNIDEVHVAVKEHDHIFVTLGARFAAWENKPPPRTRTNTCHASFGSTSTTASEDNWQPRLIRIMVWAPWACEPEKTTQEGIHAGGRSSHFVSLRQRFGEGLGRLATRRFQYIVSIRRTTSSAGTQGVSSAMRRGALRPRDQPRAAQTPPCLLRQSAPPRSRSPIRILGALQPRHGAVYSLFQVKTPFGKRCSEGEASPLSSETTSSSARDRHTTTTLATRASGRCACGAPARHRAKEVKEEAKGGEICSPLRPR